jgi:hypothetical protein
MEQQSFGELGGTKTTPQLFSSKDRRTPMTFPPVEGACAFVWRNYMLVHSGVSENDGMRGALHRYVSDLYEAGKYDFDVLQAAAVVYLKKLDELHDEREARLAGAEAVVSQIAH